ncbi:MAG: DNA-formamidopyrimidine glycosylase [Deltaproteobacteria bacterium]|nr:MAG: DNA-formamidopyrimidine glycosylase [Deltaproteobacteria bacterium]
MPELPEVQTVVDDLLKAKLVGNSIIRVQVFYPRIIAEPAAARFRNRLTGLTVTGIRRRGKYIILDLSGLSHLLIHLRMTGHLYLDTGKSRRGAHDHIVFTLSDGRRMRYHDPRKFGRLSLVNDPGKILDRLGPEPLSRAFTARALSRLMAPRRRMLKPLLLDQTFIAGLGNIYVDEALWEACLHPCRNTSTLDTRDIKRLHRAIRRVLRRGIRNGGTTLGRGETGFSSVTGRSGDNKRELRIFRRLDASCPRCRGAIRRLIVGQRSSFVCETCQPVCETGEK